MRAVLALAALVLAAAVLVVYLERDGYRDITEEAQQLSLLDCIYYATVSLSTTGYGDITPVTSKARLIEAAIVTPIRVLVLFIFVGLPLISAFLQGFGTGLSR